MAWGNIPVTTTIASLEWQLAAKVRVKRRMRRLPWIDIACCRRPVEIIFYLSAAIVGVSTVIAITALNAVHALLYLIVSLLATALVFFTLGAPFAAGLEVIIYAGAVIVLFVF